MPSELPPGWPAPAPVETLPLVWLAMAGSPWPPAVGDRPAGVSPVGSWSCERELVGSVLPGNVRTRTGLSIGAASAEISQVEGVPLSPWSTDVSRRVVVGASAELYATHAGHDADARINLGDWKVAPASGGLLSPGVSVELIERQHSGRVQANLLPMALDVVEPAWVVAMMARQIGYHSTPPPVASAVVAVPMCGGNTPEVGDLNLYAGPPYWDRSTGPLSPAGGLIASYTWPGSDLMLSSGETVLLTLNVVGTVEVRLGEDYTSAACSVSVDDDGNFSVSNGGGVASGTFTPGLDAANPSRVQLELNRQYSAGVSTLFRARGRSSPDVAFSSYVTHTASSSAAIENRVTLLADDGSSFSGAQLTTIADPALWVAPTADIDPIGGTIVGPWVSVEVDVWDTIQQVCGARLAATWVTRDKVLVCRNRDYLAGIGVEAVAFDVGERVEDLGWTVDPADSADRLEVTYAPADQQGINYTTLTPPVAWQADEVIELPPGLPVEVIADRDFFCTLRGGTPGSVDRWYPAWDPDSSAIKLALDPLWSALPNRDGSGTQPADDAVTITSREVSTGRVIITLLNNTSDTLYTVDATGQPCVILRGLSKVGHDIAATAVRGAGAAEASNVLAVDLSPWVQSADDAEAIADYVWARVSGPTWKASSVRVRLDWTRDIGDVLELVHERSDLSVKALVTKVAYDGSAGEVTQTLDLVMLPPTWADFDAAWAGKTWADFDAAWAGKTWADFDLDPTRSS